MTGPAKGAAAPFVVVGQVPRLYLDANILLPEYLRSIFLDLADEGLVRGARALGQAGARRGSP